MTNQYIYTGKKTTLNIPKIPVSKKDDLKENFIDSAAFIVDTVNPLYCKKTKGPKSLYKYNGLDLLEYQVECIKRVCKNPDIIFVTGFQSFKIIKHKLRNNYIIVENKLYDLTNNAENFRIGLNATNKSHIFWINGNFIPLIKTYEIVYNKQSSCIFTKNEAVDSVGVVFNQFNIITNYDYSSLNKVSGLYYFNQEDTNRLKRKVSLNIRPNLLDFELFDELKILAVEDKTNSVIHDGEIE